MPDCLKCDTSMIEGVKSLTFISGADTTEIQKEEAYYCTQCQQLITKQEFEFGNDDTQYSYLPARQIVQKLYLKILGREPDAGGLKHYTQQLEAGILTPSQLKEVLMNSDEYKNRFILKTENDQTEIQEDVDDLIIRC